MDNAVTPTKKRRLPKSEPLQIKGQREEPVPVIFLTHFSTLMYSIALMAFVALLLTRGESRGRSIHVLEWTLLAFSFFSALVATEFTVYQEGVSPYNLLEQPMALAVVLLLTENTFQVIGQQYQKVRAIYLKLLPVILVGWTLFFFYVISIKAHELSWQTLSLALLPIFLLLLSITLLARSFRLETGLSPLHLRAVLAHFKAISERAQSYLAYICLNLGFLMMPTIALPFRYQILKDQIAMPILHVTDVAAILWIVYCYFAFVKGRVSLLVKLTCVVITFVQFSFILLMVPLYNETEPILPEDIEVLAHSGLLFTPNTFKGYQVALTPRAWQQSLGSRIQLNAGGTADLHLQHDFMFFGKTYRKLTLYANGHLLFKDADSNGNTAIEPAEGAVYTNCLSSGPSIASYCQQDQQFSMFVRRSYDQTTITWAVPGFDKTASQARGTQLLLTSNGKLSLQYRDLTFASNIRRRAHTIGISAGATQTPALVSFQGLPISSNNNALWFDLLAMLRSNVHQAVSPLMVFMFGSTLLLFFGFRKYFRVAVMKPISDIRRNINCVGEGDFDRRLSAHAADELGQLADELNLMIDALAEARYQSDDQASLLEEELMHRVNSTYQPDKRATISKDQELCSRMHETINANLGNFDFQVAQLAEALAMSTRQLHRRILDLTSQTPSALIRGQRLEHAYHFLENKAGNVSTAAHHSGFKDVGYFSKRFQQRFGITPKALLQR